MSWKIEFDEKHRVIFLTFLEDISKEDVKESSAAVIEMIHDKDTLKILTDFTETQSLAASTLDIYRLPMDYKALGLEVRFTEAIVAPKDPKIRSAVRFYETVCVNRGIQARIFEGRDQALEWLML